jgi:hypothetical protein
MKTLIILIAIAVIALVLKACTNTDQIAKDSTRPSDDKKPTIAKENDKLIVIRNVNQEDVKKALTAFCNIYNKDSFVALPRLVTLSSDSFAIIFPYDTDFATFCFAVNYVKYPIDIKWQSQVTAWVTTKEGDDWITDKSKNKKVMLFLSDDDKEYDNVFMTTQDNIGYKLGFAAGEEKQLLQTPKKIYKAPTIQIKSLDGLPFVDIK